MPSGARVVVSTRSAGVRVTSTCTSSATASTRCSQLSRISSAGAVPTWSTIRPIRSVRRAAALIRPVTDSRTPSTSPISTATPSGEVTPASSTKCTTGCSASRPIRCASRVLPRPAGADDRGDPRAADRLGERGDVLVAADQPGRLVEQPLADRPVAGQQLGVQRPQVRARVDTEPVGEVRAVGLVAVQRGRDAVHGGDGRAAARRPPRRRAAARSRSGSAAAYSPASASRRPSGRSAHASTSAGASASR